MSIGHENAENREKYGHQHSENREREMDINAGQYPLGIKMLETEKGKLTLMLEKRGLDSNVFRKRHGHE